MNVLKRCCFRSLKENRKRTAVTVIGVVLASALITGVACMAESMRASLISYEKRVTGDFHYCFTDVSAENLKYFENNVNIERLELVREIGYAALEGSENPDKPYLYIRGIDETGAETLALELTAGRLPEREDELVISRHIRYNGMVDLQVGDVLTLQVGRRISEGSSLNQKISYLYEEEALETDQEKTYTVVGVIERPSMDVEDRYAPGYSVFTYAAEPDAAGAERNAGLYEIYATYTGRGLKNEDQVTAGILGVSDDLYNRYFHETGDYTQEEYGQLTEVSSATLRNWALIKWQTMAFADSTLGMLYGMAVLAVLVIIVTSVFCIHNSFVISLTEKMKLYGRLASVGTTSAQQRKIVYYEALFLGLAGIPLGIVSGLAASVILVKLVSGLMEEAIDIPMVFGVSVPAILAAVILSGITVLFSAMQSARRASKISPLSAIRASDSIRMGRRGLKCPGWVNRAFGVGGRIAYRNLRRARRKYRTTVVSIVVSVAVFIGLTTFVQLLRTGAGLYYQSIPYQVRVSVYGEDGYETAQKIARIDGVQAAEIYRTAILAADVDPSVLTEDYRQLFLAGENAGGLETIAVSVCSLGEEGYVRFCERIGIDPEEAKDKAIVYAQYELDTYKDGKRTVYEGSVAEYKKGDVIRLFASPEERQTETELEVAAQTQEKPMSMRNIYYNTVVLIVSDEVMDSGILPGEIYQTSNVFIQCEDAGRIEEIVRGEIQPKSYTVTNYVAQYRSERSTYLVIAIFLYGFITVVALIGITNIFNTITTNLELRAPEFAMLRSVGMTGKEFRRMIWLEGLFYGGKALLIGIPIGLAISVGFHHAFSEGIVTRYQPPLGGIVLSAAAVALLLYGIMHYSMGKINRRNIVETIQNENL